jgi:hypothetical protein
MHAGWSDKRSSLFAVSGSEKEEKKFYNIVDWFEAKLLTNPNYKQTINFVHSIMSTWTSTAYQGPLLQNLFDFPAIFCPPTASCGSRSRGRFIGQRLMLSSSFRCDQIYKYELYDFGHTLLCYLSRT